MDQKDRMEPHQQERSPVLSVAIPTYNRAETLRRQLGSLLGQIVGCQEDVEVVVSDNASSDGTATVVAEMREHFPSLRYVRNEANLGAVRNIDLAVRACRAEYVWIVGDDDMLMPFAIESVVHAARAAGQGSEPAAFISLNWVRVSPDNAWITASSMPASLRSGLVPDAAGVFLALDYPAIGHITRLVVRRPDWVAAPFVVEGPWALLAHVKHLLTIGKSRAAYFVGLPVVGWRVIHSPAYFLNHGALCMCIELPSYDWVLVHEWGIARREVARLQRRRWRPTYRALVKVNLFKEYEPYWPRVDSAPLLTIEGRAVRWAARILLRDRPWSPRMRRLVEPMLQAPMPTDESLYEVP
jgi:glycosyltransferase involved in cell wall biosynthesis